MLGESDGGLTDFSLAVSAIWLTPLGSSETDSIYLSVGRLPGVWQDE